MLKFNKFPPQEPADVEFSADSLIQIQIASEDADRSKEGADEAVLGIHNLGRFVGSLLATNVENNSGSAVGYILRDGLAREIPEGDLRDAFFFGAGHGVSAEYDALDEVEAMRGSEL